MSAANYYKRKLFLNTNSTFENTVDYFNSRHFQRIAMKGISCLIIQIPNPKSQIPDPKTQTPDSKSEISEPSP